jgi:UDP-glucose 4-epimerase
LDILITGAGGRIGSSLARILVAEGHRVRGFGFPGDPGLHAATGIDVFEGDLTDRASLVDAVAGVDVICHLAAALTTHEVHDDAFVAANFDGTYNLLSAAKEHAPAITRFVYTSSDAVYWPALANRPLYLPIDESHPLLAGSVYGATKVGAEAMCRAFWRSYGIPFVIMRPTATAFPRELVDPASPFGRRWFVASAIARLERMATRSVGDDALLATLKELDGGTPRLFVPVTPDGEASLSMLTHPEDVARAMRAMIDTPEAVGEAFNVGPEAPHSERMLVSRLAERLGVDMVEIPHESVRPSWYISSAKARAVLGYHPKYSVFDMVDTAAEEIGR